MNCKPGDLAIYVSARYPENIGAIVEVVGPWEKDFDWQRVLPSDFVWLVRTKGRLLLNNRGYGNEKPCLDKHLRPIRPGDEPVEITRELETV
jgi:hypothetical protein